jgi:autophagy-related protein 5
MPATPGAFTALQAKVWNGSIALEIRLAASDCRTYDDSEPYLLQFPRLSYLAFVLPQLHAFFAPSLIDPNVSPHDAWLSFEDVPLKWHYPLGLLYDLFSGAEPVDVEGSGPREQTGLHEATTGGEGNVAIVPIPWKLTIHYSEFPAEQLMQLDAEGRTMQDTFVNAIKEADFVRNGTARAAMSLSKQDSDNLWLAVQKRASPHRPDEPSRSLTVPDDRALFNSVNSKLLNPPGVDLRHAPTKIYLPTSASKNASETISEEATPGHLRVVQTLIPLSLPSKQPQTLGTALHGILPSIFPSRRSPIYARPVLHGVAVPLIARIDELSKAASYTDGFLHIAIVMHG